MKSAPLIQTPKTATEPAAVPRSIDRLGFYRVLASFPALASFRAKLNAVVLIGTLLPAFLLVLRSSWAPVGSVRSR